MTKAVLKFYHNNKFEMGAYINHDGGVDGVLRVVMETLLLQNLRSEVSYMEIWEKIQTFSTEHIYKYLKVEKKRLAFYNQLNSDGTPVGTGVIFWGINLSNKDLEKHFIFPDITYEIRVLEDQKTTPFKILKKISVKMIYGGQETKSHYKVGFPVFTGKDEQLEQYLNELKKVIIKIDNELADCDCGEEKTISL
jgi:hypothetical protein